MAIEEAKDSEEKNSNFSTLAIENNTINNSKSKNWTQNKAKTLAKSPVETTIKKTIMLISV